MSKRLLLIGYGMQGQAALHDLARCEEFSRITVADSRPGLSELLKPYSNRNVVGVPADASDEKLLAALIRDCDIVIEALPSTFALRTGELAVSCGVPLVSSMFYFNPGLDAPGAGAQRDRISKLDQMAQERGVAILTEFGMDPGLDLMMAAKAISEFDEVHVFRTYGAGLPAGNARENPLQYKFSWSPIGVMRAYNRPATMIREGRTRNVPAEEIFEAHNCHLIDVPELGTPLECFPNGDAVHYAGLLGIRGALKESGRYTGRYPGHCAFWNRVVRSGLLGGEPVPVAGTAVSPAEFMAAALSRQPQFQYTGDDRDLCFIRVEAAGVRGARPWHVVYQLIDYRDLQTGLTAMQRTVGFTLSRGAQLLATRKLSRTGLLTALDVPYEDVFPALESHGIRVQTTRA